MLLLECLLNRDPDLTCHRCPQVAIVGSWVSVIYDGSRDSCAGQLAELWRQKEGQAKVCERKKWKDQKLEEALELEMESKSGNIKRQP